jgi:hypothetical protein
MALGRAAADKTASYVDASYQFEALEGYSHWLLEEAPGKMSELILSHLKAAQEGQIG